MGPLMDERDAPERMSLVARLGAREQICLQNGNKII